MNKYYAIIVGLFFVSGCSSSDVITPSAETDAAAVEEWSERTLVANSESKPGMWIDLDTGKLWTPPNDLGSRLIEVAREEGFDAYAHHDPDGQPLGLYSIDLTGLQELPGDGWLNANPYDLSKSWPTNQYSYGLLATDSPLPYTFAFRTREGGVGMLQVVGFTQPQSISMRYKLAEP